MRLLFKTFAFIFVGILALLTLNGALMVRREMRLFDGDMRGDALLLGHAMEQLVQDAWRSSGESRMLELVDAANRDQTKVRIRWVWLDVPAGTPQSPQLGASDLAALRGGQDVSIKQPAAGDGHRLTYVPVEVGDRHGALELRESLGPLRAYTHETVLRVTLLAAIMALLVLVLMWIFGLKFVGRPLAALMDKIRRTGGGDFGGDVHLRGHDELARLGEALNTMSARLDGAHAALIQETEARIEALEHLRHTERLAKIGHLASGIAHELGTPLNVVAGRAKLIAMDALEPAEARESAATIGAQAERMTAIIRQLLDFARRSPSQRTRGDLEGVARQSLDLLRSAAQKARVSLDLDVDDALPQVEIDATQMQQVLINLIMNGIQAMPDGGRLTVRLGRREAGQPPRDCAVVEVVDQGQGIDAEHLNNTQRLDPGL